MSIKNVVSKIYWNEYNISVSTQPKSNILNKPWAVLKNPKPSKWRPHSPLGWVKINFDVAIRPNNSMVAAVCRKENGDNPICSLSSSSIGSSSWEVIVALLALKLSALLNLSFVRFKVDSSTVIEALQISASPPPDFLVYVMSNVDASLRSLSCWEFCYARRNLKFFSPKHCFLGSIL